MVEAVHYKLGAFALSSMRHCWRLAVMVDLAEVEFWLTCDAVVVLCLKKLPVVMSLVFVICDNSLLALGVFDVHVCFFRFAAHT